MIYVVCLIALACFELKNLYDLFNANKEDAEKKLEHLITSHHVDSRSTLYKTRILLTMLSCFYILTIYLSAVVSTSQTVHWFAVFLIIMRVQRGAKQWYVLNGVHGTFKQTSTSMSYVRIFIHIAYVVLALFLH